MKNIIFPWILFSLLFLFIVSCKKDVRTLDLSVTPVTSLVSPSDGVDFKLDPIAGSSFVFRWTKAQTLDSGIILYEIAFDKLDGDFSHPIYKSVSDGSGMQLQATITQKELNKIASLAGIQSSGTGKIKWAVFASKASNSKISQVTRTLQVERPAGFAVVPDSLFITGTATEAGSDITKAIALKKIEDGVFELYTSLKAGSYLLTDHRTTGGTTYYLDANNIIKQGNTPTEIKDTAKQFRLIYDFNLATFQSLEIQSVGLYMSAYNTEIGQLKYIGNSTWEGASIPVVFYPFSWGRDERYKFILHTQNGLKYWGSQNANNAPPAGQGDSYFYLLPVTNAQWDNTYKFDPSADLHNVKVDVYFRSNGPYKHTVTTLQ